MQLTHRISFRLFVLLCVAMAVIFGGYLYLNSKLQEKHLLDCATKSGIEASEMVLATFQYSMLRNDRRDIDLIINALASEKRVRELRIINKKGEITFASLPSEVGKAVDKKADACYLCLDSSEPVTHPSTSKRTRLYKTPSGEQLLGIITPIKNFPECSNAACHAHPPDISVLGVFDLILDFSYTQNCLAESRSQSLLYGTISIMIFAMLFAVFIYKVVARPIRDLSAGTQELAKGNLDFQIETRRQDEIGELAQSFNTMTRELSKARDQITELNRSLEKRVQHKRQQLRVAEEHMREIDKLASLGKLAASVAHELNNPLAGILTYSKLTERKLTNQGGDIDPEILRILKVIQDETARCGQIVKDLLLFARREGSAFEEVSLHNVLEKSLTIVWHKFEMHKIEVVKKLELEDDRLQCDPAQLQQALVALLINAAEAVHEGGRINIETAALSDKQISIKISDTGVGIPPEIRKHIFEPFFSTKEESKGVGLGLSVVYGIIRRHKGEIAVESEVGQGTTFIISLPKNSKKNEAKLMT